MAKYNNQKAKILFLQQMLYETSIDHTISMREILESLQSKEIRAERKSIYDDMEVLRFFGMDIRFKRERPSGYYCAGTKGKIPRLQAEPQSTSPEEPKGDTVENEQPAAEDTTELQDQGEKMDTTSWMKPVKSEKKKQMRLLCSTRGRKAAWEYFGDTAEYKRRDDDFYIITAPLLEDTGFFGWLTAFGGDVRIIKPKKTAQAFREFLKGLLKEYK